jgi:hypothetical protein
MPKALKTAPLPPAGPDFAQRLVRWQREQGRHGLPWQGTADPYKVWLLLPAVLATISLGA